MSEHTFVANGQTHCRCGLPELERLAAPSPALTREALRHVIIDVLDKLIEVDDYSLDDAADAILAALSEVPPPSSTREET